MEVYKGRPENADTRLPREKRVYDFLDSMGIQYSRVDHSSAFTMEDCKSIDEALGVALCKNLFLCTGNKKQYFLLLMPDDKPFKTKNITAQIGTGRLSFGSADKMLEYLDIEPGAVSVMGLMNDHDNSVKLLVDKDLLDEEYFACHPCVNTSSIRLKTSDVFGLYLKEVHHDMQVVELPREID
ncbi:MAG: prolyl-tRNA synthetase associated domain-containing protein [Lachnospiraceae bacterium]|nr:prolyl-tRNA synthetase associated domain-containing protein [Candidatus Darwinimomas equi]